MLTILLTWYSKQKYNNPFTPWFNIKIVGHNGDSYIQCNRRVKNKENNVLLFFLPGISQNSVKTVPLNLSDIPTLITLTGQHTIHKLFKTPPSNWVILGDSLTSTMELIVPKTWPTPLFTNNFNGADNVKMYNVYPFSDTIPCINFSYNNIDMLIIHKTTNIPDSTKESIFKEKYDVVILRNFNDIHVMKIHRLLRPQFTVIIQPRKNNASLQAISNIIQSDSNDFTFTVSKDKKNKVSINKEE